MPSLSALKQFKASFNDIGGEKADCAAKNVPFDDLELPNSESEPLEIPEGTAGAETGVAAASDDNGPDILGDLNPEGGDSDFNLDDLDSLGLNLDGSDKPSAPAEDVSAETAETPVISDDDLDFGAFLDAIPDDLGLPESPADFEAAAEVPAAAGTELAEIPDPDFETEPEAADAGLSDLEALDLDAAALKPDAAESAPETGAADFSADDFSIPNELLSGLSEDIESVPADFPEEGAAAPPEDSSLPDPGDGTAGFDLGGDTAGFDLGGDAAGFDLGGDAAGLDLGGDAGLDLGGDAADLTAAGGLEIPELPETEELDAELAEAPDLGGIPDIDAEPEAGDQSDTAGFDLGGDAAGFDLGGDAAGLDLGGDTGIDLGGDAADLTAAGGFE
ncbi:MAG: hypothetical protein LBS57_03285, partial [Treponema sp.]|nr:hypothetical protein [Treponema sp.]